MGTCYECHAPLLNGQRFGHCAGCHRSFMGIVAFDKHRRGPAENRVCIDPETDDAVTKTGKPVAKWWLDKNGRWHDGERDPRFDNEGNDDDDE